MSYDPTTDFLGLARRTADGAELARAPMLDLTLSALARAGVISLSVGQTAPTANQATTVWLQPAQPSWTAEGVVKLWDPSTSQYVRATPELWVVVLSRQQNGSNFIHVGTQLIQWGSVQATTTYEDTRVTFPKPFSDTARVQTTVNGAGAVVAVGTTVVNNLGFNVAVASGPPVFVDWLATGPA